MSLESKRIKSLSICIALNIALLLPGCGGSSDTGEGFDESSDRLSCTTKHEHESGEFSLDDHVAVHLEGSDSDTRYDLDTGEHMSDLIRYRVDDGEDIRIVHSHEDHVQVTLHGPNGTVGLLSKGEELVAEDLEGGVYTIELKNSGPETYVHLLSSRCEQEEATELRASSEGVTMTVSSAARVITYPAIPLIIGTTKNSKFAGSRQNVTSEGALEFFLGTSEDSRFHRAVRAHLREGGSVSVFPVNGDESTPSLSALLAAVRRLQSYGKNYTITFADIPVMSRSDVATLYSTAASMAEATQSLVVGGLPSSISSASEAAAFVQGSLPKSTALAVYYPQNTGENASDAFDVGVLVSAVLARGDRNAGPWHIPTGESSQLSSFRGPSSDGGAALSHARVNQVVSSGGGAQLQGQFLLGSKDRLSTIHERRSANSIAATVPTFMQPYVFTKSTPMLWKLLREGVSNYMAQLDAAGAFSHASDGKPFAVACDLGVTMTGSDVLNRRLILTLAFRPQQSTQNVQVGFLQIQAPH